MMDIELLQERYHLVSDRIREMLLEKTVSEDFRDYFHTMARFIQMTDKLRSDLANGWHLQASLEQLKRLNHQLYEDILPLNYSKSYGNPDYAVKRAGAGYGQLLSFLYTEIRGLIAYAYENRLWDMTIICELFIQIYNYFVEEESPDLKRLKEVIYWYISDYSDMTLDDRFREQVDPELSFNTDIILNADLTDLRYLYHFGEYISENEIQTALYLNQLSDEDIDQMAETFVGGYVRGFEASKIDLSKKKTVVIHTNIGFERVIKAAIEKFGAIGLKTIIFRSAVGSINKKASRIGIISTSPNDQYDYDHRFDQALYLDKALNERKLAVSKRVYEKYKELARDYAGPACLEVFGETPFVPESKDSVLKLDDKQQKLMIQYTNQNATLSNEYMDRSKISFTIIAYPVAAIGSDYEAVFRETVKVNTLDSRRYESIQKTIIDVLDRADYVYIKGNNGNTTELTVKLAHLKDADKETKFENCVADVNIPVGEVFTSPMLEGTTGTVNVSSVYLNGLNYVNFSMTFEDGMVRDYSCDNFETKEENRKYIKDNVLMNHDTLPMGEFAIGTNTTAYVMARKFKIMEKLPILIIEKMGPHFAVGDTCFSRSEDNQTFNSDCKEMIAKDNEVSVLRKTDVEKAYFNCHTDITIPYDEIGEITAVTLEGDQICLIANGRFCLEGTEELNDVFDD